MAEGRLPTFAERETSAHDGSTQTLTQPAHKLKAQGYFSRLSGAAHRYYGRIWQSGPIHYLSVISPVTCSRCTASCAALLPAKTLTQPCCDCECTGSHFLLISREIKLRLVKRPGEAGSCRKEDLSDVKKTLERMEKWREKWIFQCGTVTHF